MTEWKEIKLETIPSTGSGTSLLLAEPVEATDASTTASSS